MRCVQSNWFLVVLVLMCAMSGSTTSGADAVVPRFKKLQLTNRYYCDGIDAGDINGDGHMDIVFGPYWCEGPDFKAKHPFYPDVPLPPEVSPSNSMFSFVRDFSGDGQLDILVLGRVHKHSAYWYENPGKGDGDWKKHFAFERVRGESPTLFQLGKNPSPKLLSHWDGRWGWIEPSGKSAKQPWQFRSIGQDLDWPQFYHGQGIGDVNNDGRQDVILNDGWYEQPASDAKQWKLHRHRFAKGRGGAQMFAYDVDGDGDNDIITALDGHGWGLAWFEQTTVSGKRDFKQHTIMLDREHEAKYGVAFSQPHALELADIDGDGLKDIVTGKRRWAHGPKGDIEPNAAPVVYWFQLVRDKSGVRYVPHLIDDNSGVGVQIAVKDVNGDKRLDVLTASKLGAFVFLNQGD